MNYSEFHELISTYVTKFKVGEPVTFEPDHFGIIRLYIHRQDRRKLSRKKIREIEFYLPAFIKLKVVHKSHAWFKKNDFIFLKFTNSASLAEIEA